LAARQDEAGVAAAPVVEAVVGATVELLPQRVAYWREASTLLVADLHLGKADALRAGGLPLSDMVLLGVLDKDLGRLRNAIEVTGARRVLILGDLLHATMGVTPQVVARFEAWREAVARGCGEVRFEIVPGNHDRAIGKVVDAWKLQVLSERHEEGPFAFVHEPPGSGELRKLKYTWCGHTHPAVWVGPRSSGMKLACFQIGERVGVLPAFSLFTAGGVVARTNSQRVFAIADDCVVEV